MPFCKKNSLYVTRSFLSSLLLNELWNPFHLIYSWSWSTFLLITSPIQIFTWLAFSNSFLKNIQTLSSSLRSLITYVHGTVFLTFFNHKNFFWPILNVTFCINVFIFWYYYMLTNFKSGSSLLLGIIKPCIQLHLPPSTSTQLHPALCNTINVIKTKMPHMIGPFSKIWVTKFKVVHFDWKLAHMVSWRCYFWILI